MDNSTIGALSVEEFCQRHHIGRTTFYAEVAAGRIRPVKAGRRTLVPVRECERWLASLPAMSSNTSDTARRYDDRG